MRVLRSIGGSWEQWEDELTYDRFVALMESEEEVPPLYVTGYLVAVYFGAMKPSHKSHGSAPSGADAFISEFGASGQLTGSMGIWGNG